MRKLSHVHDFSMIRQHGSLTEGFIAYHASKPHSAMRSLRVPLHRGTRFEDTLAVSARESHADVLTLVMLFPSVEIAIFGETQRAAVPAFGVDDLLVTRQHCASTEFQLAFVAF